MLYSHLEYIMTGFEAEVLTTFIGLFYFGGKKKKFGNTTEASS